MEEVRSSTLSHCVQPCRSRVPPASSAVLGAQVPMAVVAPIKRELPDEVPLVPDETTAALLAAAEKYSLPPFETLVPSHRSPEMATRSPSTTATDKHPTIGVPSPVGVPSSAVSVSPETMVRLPGIHQLFQTTSGQPVITGNGSGGMSAAAAAANDEAMRQAWAAQSATMAVAAATPTNQPTLSQQQVVQFFKTEEDLAPVHELPPPPPYPGLPGPGSTGRPYLAYHGGVVRNGVAEYVGSFQSVTSSCRR